MKRFQKTHIQEGGYGNANIGRKGGQGTPDEVRSWGVSSEQVLDTQSININRTILLNGLWSLFAEKLSQQNVIL